MAINLPEGARLKTSAKIYFGKYPFKVHFQAIRPDGLKASWSWTSDEAASVMHNLNTNLSEEFKKRNRVAQTPSYSTFISYLATEDDVNEYLNAFDYDKTRHRVEISQLTPEQQETIKLDAKIVVRDDFYYEKFQYKIAFKGIDSDTIDALLAQFLTDAEIKSFEKASEKDNRWRWRRDQTEKRFGKTASNDRVRLHFGWSNEYSSTNLYFKEEEDIAMARLMISSNAKIYKVMKG